MSTLTKWTSPLEVGKGRIRTYEEKISTELQSAAFSHSATLPLFAPFLKRRFFLSADLANMCKAVEWLFDTLFSK